jgi:hypothetical protein
MNVTCTLRQPRALGGLDWVGFGWTSRLLMCLRSHGYGRQLLYDILNDSYDVTERKTGSAICRLAMATSFLFDTFFCFHLWLWRAVIDSGALTSSVAMVVVLAMARGGLVRGPGSRTIGLFYSCFS